jgi:glycosyltransferase involved in cell wall biosynthesis
MKILIVQDHLRSGGTERQTLSLARAFRGEDHDARVLTFRPGGALTAATDQPPIASLQCFDTGLDWFAPGLLRRVRDVAPDILLAMGRMANCHAWRIQQRFPELPVVATVRTGKPLPWLYRKSLATARAVVCNSHETATRLSTSGDFSNRLSVIHNALVLETRIQDSGARNTTRLSLGATPSTCVLVNVAMFRPEKNQRALLEAARLLSPDADWALWLVGDGPERTACESLAARFGLGERVRFLGLQADPRAYYQAADIAVHASTSESLSNFLGEAQAHGLPVAAWGAQGVRESVLDGKSGLVLPIGDVPALANAVQHLLTDPELRRQMGAEARRHALDSFAAVAQTRRYLDLFASLLKR